MKNYLRDINEQSKEQVARVKKQFKSNGFNVDIGG